MIVKSLKLWYCKVHSVCQQCFFRAISSLEFTRMLMNRYRRDIFIFLLIKKTYDEKSARSPFEAQKQQLIWWARKQRLGYLLSVPSHSQTSALSHGRWRNRGTLHSFGSLHYSVNIRGQTTAEREPSDYNKSTFPKQQERYFDGSRMDWKRT